MDLDEGIVSESLTCRASMPVIDDSGSTTITGDIVGDTVKIDRHDERVTKALECPTKEGRNGK